MFLHFRVKTRTCQWHHHYLKERLVQKPEFRIIVQEKKAGRGGTSFAQRSLCWAFSHCILPSLVMSLLVPVRTKVSLHGGPEVLSSGNQKAMETEPTQNILRLDSNAQFWTNNDSCIRLSVVLTTKPGPCTRYISSLPEDFEGSAVRKLLKLHWDDGLTRLWETQCLKPRGGPRTTSYKTRNLPRWKASRHPRPDSSSRAGGEAGPGRAGPGPRLAAPLRWAGPLLAVGRDQAAAMSAGKGETTPRNEPRAHPPRFWKSLKAQTARDTQLA